MREEAPKKLPTDTYTDWFIHEARNALAVSNEVPGIEWKIEDYKHNRGILRRFSKNSKLPNPNISGQGELSREQIDAFVEKAVSKPWNKVQANKVKEEFQSLLKSIED